MHQGFFISETLALCFRKAPRATRSNALIAMVLTILTAQPLAGALDKRRGGRFSVHLSLDPSAGLAVGCTCSVWLRLDQRGSMPLGKLAHSYRHSHALHTRLTEAYHHLQACLQSAPLGKLQACRLDHHRAAAGLRNDAGRSAAHLVRSPVRRTLAEAMRHQRRRCATLRHAAPLRIPSFRDRGRLEEAHAHPCLYTAAP